MSEDLRSAAIDEGRSYKPYQETGKNENLRMRAEKNVWWEEDVY